MKKFLENLRGIFIKIFHFQGFHRNCKACRDEISFRYFVPFGEQLKNFSKKNCGTKTTFHERYASCVHNISKLANISKSWKYVSNVKFGKNEWNVVRNSLYVLSTRGKHSIQSLPALLLNFTRVYARVYSRESRVHEGKNGRGIRTEGTNVLSRIVTLCPTCERAPASRYTSPTRRSVRLSTRARFSRVRSF